MVFCLLYTHIIYAEVAAKNHNFPSAHTFCWKTRKTRKTLNFQFGFNFLFGIAWLTPNCDETVDMQPFHEFLKYLNVRHCQWTELFKKGPISKLKLQQYIDFTEGQISQTFTFYSTEALSCLHRASLWLHLPMHPEKSLLAHASKILYGE